MVLTETTDMNKIYGVSQLGQMEEKKGGQAWSLLTQRISDRNSPREQKTQVQQSDANRADELAYDLKFLTLQDNVLCIISGRTMDWEELCIQKLQPQRG